MLVMIFTLVGDTGAENRIEPVGKQRIVARIGIAPPRLLRQRDGALRQALEDEIVQFAAFGELDRRFDPIA